MQNLWLKIKIWTKITVFTLVMLFLLIFVFNNSNKGVSIWVWFDEEEVHTTVLKLIVCMLLAGVLGTLLVRMAFGTLKQIRELRKRKATRANAKGCGRTQVEGVDAANQAGGAEGCGGADAVRGKPAVLSSTRSDRVALPLNSGYYWGMSIAILDYGMANLRSVQKAFAHVGAEAAIISRPEEIDRAERLVLPGVGAFKDAVATLRERKLSDAILGHIRKGKLFLGICLGLQMLVDVGFEDGEHRGLGIIPGKCVRFDVDSTLGLKVPHMGWNQLIAQIPRRCWRICRRDAAYISCTGITWFPTTRP